MSDRCPSCRKDLHFPLPLREHAEFARHGKRGRVLLVCAYCRCVLGVNEEGITYLLNDAEMGALTDVEQRAVAALRNLAVARIRCATALNN